MRFLNFPHQLTQLAPVILRKILNYTNFRRTVSTDYICLKMVWFNSLGVDTISLTFYSLKLLVGLWIS
jgi:hypothetical protein